MNKDLIAAAFVALVFFGLGIYVGFMQGSAAPPRPLESPQHAQAIATLRSDNQSLKAEVERLHDDVELLNTANARLTAQRAALPASAASATTPRSATLGVSIGQQQMAMINNLRQLAAARDQFRLENGRFPTSVHEIVGATSYIKAVKTVGGEDYSALPVNSMQPLTVTTPGGLSVTYDSVGGNSTRPEFTPAEQQAMELGRRVEPTIKKAIEAYRAAHNGNPPPNEQATLPYFASPQEGADFLEYQKARRAVGL